MASPPPELPAGTPWWVGAGIAAISTVGGVVIAVLTLLMGRRGAATGGATPPVGPSDSPSPARPPPAPGVDQVLAVAERQWDRERDRYESRIDDLETETRSLRAEVTQLRQEVAWTRSMLERYAPPRPP